MERKLFRSRYNRWLAGVCGGLAKYFNIDVVVVRILAVVALCLLFWVTLVAYIVMACVVPLEDKKTVDSV
jgi:phage shock protein PspC (stress-responsive transcriptional regulator)